MASRYYSSVAAVTTLSNGVSPGGTSFIVGSTSGFPVQTPFTLLIDEGTPNEEIVSVTNVAGTTLTVSRGEDGTVAVAHDPGARVRHAMTARDLRESREHEDKTTNVHGIADVANLVTRDGAQTLSNKTVSGTLPILGSATLGYPASGAVTASGVSMTAPPTSYPVGTSFRYVDNWTIAGPDTLTSPLGDKLWVVKTERIASPAVAPGSDVDRLTRQTAWSSVFRGSDSATIDRVYSRVWSGTFWTPWRQAGLGGASIDKDGNATFAGLNGRPVPRILTGTLSRSVVLGSKEEIFNTVSLSEAGFTATPRITASLAHSSGQWNGWSLQIFSKSTTQFGLVARGPATTAAMTLDIDWIAVQA